MVRRVRRSSGPLDLRSQAILRAVIEEYVTTAAPVGSAALVDRYRVPVLVKGVMRADDARRAVDAGAAASPRKRPTSSRTSSWHRRTATSWCSRTPDVCSG